ncbi:hypothetical protein GOB57_24225 [Sinorhizobium meliloti]|nr:hypothetical protein [Sinorhizobium meliloti]
MMDVIEQIEAILDRATQDFDGRDEVLRRAAHEIRTLRGSAAIPPLRIAKANGDTLAEMRDNVRKGPLYASGDAVLVWVNQGDLIHHQLLGSVKEAVPDGT